MKQFGKLDILVNNAAHQASFDNIEDIGAEEWDVTFRTNIYSQFYLCKAAIPHMKPSGPISATQRNTGPVPACQDPPNRIVDDRGHLRMPRLGQVTHIGL